MAKVGGVAAELAKQAAQAALAEAGEDAPAKSKADGWVPPELGRFKLDEALSRAYMQATGYLNFMLSPEGLVIDLQHAPSETTADVREAETSRVYRTYAGEDMLKLYAAQRGERGVVADGQV